MFLLAFPLLAVGVSLAIASLAWGLSWWSMSIACGFVTLASAAFARNGRSALIGLALLLGPFLVHALLAGDSANYALRVLPGDHGTRVVDTLVPERDGSLIAAGLLTLFSPLNDDEAPRFVDVLGRAYENAGKMPRPTPAVATYLGLQSERAFDAIVIAPEGDQPVRKAAIFLHGFAGNFYVYCWEFAQAARSAGMLTICPSTSPRGTWWNEPSDAIFRETLAHLRGLGVQTVVLAGLSNGGAGASVIARKHAHELAGLVLISGVSSVAPSGLPTLVIQGRTDRMMSPAAARSYAKQSPRIRYRELAGGHLIFLSQAEQVRPMIAEFLRKL